MPKREITSDEWWERIEAIVALTDTQSQGSKADMTCSLIYATVSVIAAATSNCNEHLEVARNLLHRQADELLDEIAKRRESVNAKEI